ncbi:hypothetical protein [Sinosporangium siamense]|uniref:hypothetical protein n=1 Tax=Sinosporangium siamense TaxID=1367973 RepID=UPI00194EE8D7|nr:hypothetical protein [Sinosporangium siamense]
MNKATAAEAPIGVPTAISVNSQWSTGGTGATVTRIGTGAYEVRLPGVASSTGIVHVTAYRTHYRGRTCAVTGYGPSGADELVEVQCYDENGAPVDWWFTVHFTAPTAINYAYATVHHTGTQPNSGTFNSDGQTNSVVRDSTGQYRAVIPGASFVSGTGHIKLTAYEATGARCSAQAGTAAGGALEIPVSCYAISTGALVDAKWLLSYSVGGDAAAYTTVTAGPAIDTGRSYSVTGETPTVERIGTGWYRVTWQNVGILFGNVQVTSTATDGRYCHLGTINDYSAPPRLTVDVYCHTTAGLLGDSTFGVSYMRRPPASCVSQET